MRTLRSVSLLALASAAVASQAVTIDFESVTTSQAALIGDGYAGLNWSNFYVYRDDYNPAAVPGGAAAITSGRYGAGNNIGNPASLSVAAGGDLVRTLYGNFTQNLPDRSVRIDGYLGNVLVGSATFALSSSPRSYGLAFAGGADRIVFTSLRNSGSQQGFYVDDLRINAPTSAVPGPVAALPFALMAIKRRKRA